MNSLMHFQCTGLGEILPAQIALERDGIVTVESLMSSQIGQLLEDPSANIALDGIGIPVVMFVLRQLQTVSECEIAEFALRFID